MNDREKCLGCPGNGKPVLCAWINPGVLILDLSAEKVLPPTALASMGMSGLLLVADMVERNDKGSDDALAEVERILSEGGPA